MKAHIKPSDTARSLILANRRTHETDTAASGTAKDDFCGAADATKQEVNVKREGVIRTLLANDVESRIQSLSTNDLRELTLFAQFRLARVALPTCDAEDVVQDSISAVMLGIRTEAQGRKPRPSDVIENDAFSNYLKGVISSVVEAMRRRTYGRQFVPVQDETLKLEPSFANDLALRDFSQHFFQRLEDRIPDDLRRILREWAGQWTDCHSIPIGDRHRRTRQRLRRMAAETFMELTAGTRK